MALYLVGRRSSSSSPTPAQLPAVLALVFREAFSLRRAAWAAPRASAMMVAMRYGLARGIYANEAGYGTAAVAYGTARSDASRCSRGCNAVMEVFIVSFVTSTHQRAHHPGDGRLALGAHRARPRWPQAFNTAMPAAGGWIVAFCAFLFGYTTLIGWAYYGEQFLEYVFGPRVTVPYRWVYCGLIVFGAIEQGRPGLGLGRPDERPADLSRTSSA